jgi:hypothetical protein
MRDCSLVGLVEFGLQLTVHFVAEIVGHHLQILRLVVKLVLHVESQLGQFTHSLLVKKIQSQLQTLQESPTIVTSRFDRSKKTVRFYHN